MGNFLVVLFKNRKKKKIIKEFKTYRRAKVLYEKLKGESDNVLFEGRISNTEEFKLELGLVEINGSTLVPIYLTDEFGRNMKVKLEEDNMSLFEICPFRQEEMFYDFQNEMKISSQSFITKYLKTKELKMVSTLNNKIVVQIDDNINLFSFKNESESMRFADFLTQYLFKNKRSDCLVIKDTSVPQKKYLYKLLEEKGFDKKYLYRKKTTFQRVHPK